MTVYEQALFDSIMADSIEKSRMYYGKRFISRWLARAIENQRTDVIVKLLDISGIDSTPALKERVAMFYLLESED